MYARIHNITNVLGRKKYISKKDKEELVGFFDTAPKGFWRLLAQENQKQFLCSSNVNRKNAKASEAREIVYGLPPYANDETTAQALALQVKIKLGVECMVGVHKKRTRNQHGERVLNLHAHIVFAERTLLSEPIHIKEKRAERTYYYNAAGKKCAKADAVKITKKGTVIQEECTRFFSNKINFFNIRKSIDPLLDDLAKQFQFERFDITKHFPQKKIGKNNPKEKFIVEYNELVREMNAFFDKINAEKNPSSAKETFCKEYDVPQRFSISQVADVRKKFEAFRLEFEVSEEELRHELEVLRAKAKELQTDIDRTEAILQFEPGDYVNEKLVAIYRKELERKYPKCINQSFLDDLIDKLEKILAIIAAIIAKLFARGLKEQKEIDQQADIANTEIER